MRIVFDTNVLFSAFTTHGVCTGLYEESLQRAIIVVSHEILAELEEKLRTKAKLTSEEAVEVISAVRFDAEVVEVSQLPSPICRDPDDDWVLAAALSARATVIVTGDQDLLVLKEIEGVRVLSPRECLVLLSLG